MMNAGKETRIVFLGPPGAGKGTQAVVLAAKLKIPHISTGEMMRAAVQSGSPLGQTVKGFLDGGALVPDATVVEVVRDRIGQQDCGNGFLLDGFPRTVAQAVALTEVLSKIGRPLTHVLDLSVPESVLMERIKSRGLKGSGRSDDSAEVAAKRYQVYLEQTAPVAGYYREIGSVIEIDGLGTVEEVQDRIFRVI